MHIWTSSIGERLVTRRVVTLHNGTDEIQAWCHVANPSTIDDTLKPYGWYKRFLVEGGRVHNLPAEYQVLLAAIEAIEDGNQERDARRRAIGCNEV